MILIIFHVLIGHLCIFYPLLLIFKYIIFIFEWIFIYCAWKYILWIFYHSVICLIIFKRFILIGNYFNWNGIQFFICFILWCVLYVLFKKTLPILRLWRYSLIFYSTNFIFLAFMFRSMVCLKVIFVFGWLAV